MSMHKLTAGDGYAYLTHHVAAGDAGLEAGASLTGYYEQTGNPPGRWYGSGLAGLGSEAIGRATPGDVVTEPAMAAVFRDGHDPVTGAALGHPYPRFDTTERRAVVGYDLTFTAPKSVSVLWALADHATRTTVYEAHRAALAAVVAVSELYDALLADELARRLPVEWSMRDRGPRRNRAFELTGIGEDLLAHFSTRAEQIHCAEQEWATRFEADHGRAPTRVETTRARQHLTRATRPPKKVRCLADLLADWSNRARALTGIEPRDLAARALNGTYGRALHAHDVGPEVRAAMVAQVLTDVSTRRSVW